MSIDRTNSEGYPDPTAYQALSVIERQEKAEKTRWRRFRPLVYICSPFSGDTETNKQNARIYSRFAVDQGFIPLAPHLLFTQFLDDGIPEERHIGLLSGKVLMDLCSEVWVFGNTISNGMRWEIERARRKNYLLRHFNERCEEIQDD